jgi:uncharacterized protein YjbJ (UPF0337 family)
MVPAQPLCPFGWVLQYGTLVAFREMEWRRMEASMDKDRIKGSAKRAKGKVKEVAGKVLGDSKLKSEGKGDQVKGKMQNAIGGIKDTLRGK